MVTEFLILIILGLAPSFVWLLFYLKEDAHPEPKRWIVLAFLAGIGSVFAALVIQKAILHFIDFPIDLAPPLQLTLSIIFFFLGAALVEEITKFAACRTVMWKNPVLDEPVDAMIYMVVAALGFAAMENMLLLTTLEDSALLTEGAPIILMRMIGANFLHALASGILGFGWAMALASRRPLKKFAYFGAGLVGATILHAVFNLMILNLGALYFFPVTVMLFIAALIVLREFDILKKLQERL